jgi:hypothetical protein
MTLIKSKQRVAEHGEVFTPPWLVEAMLDVVQGETERIDSRFLEPACGSGNFLVAILRRKLAAVHVKFGESEFERRHYALLAVMCVYGIEIQADNVVECRRNLVADVASFLSMSETDALHQATQFVLSRNIVHGDALSMTMGTGDPITFAEWGYLGRGRFQRRDFRLDSLTRMASLSKAGTLWKNHRHSVFTPAETYPPATISELAAQFAAQNL